MVIFFVLLIVFGLVMGVIGVAAEEGGLIFFGIPFLAAGIFFGVRFGMHVNNREHFRALRDLHAEGWIIQSNQIHYQDGKASVDCLSFKLKKEKGKYTLVVPRPSGNGGGYNILPPKQTETGAKVICQNLT